MKRIILIKRRDVAKNARKELEQETGESVVIEENYLEKDEKEAREKKKKRKIQINYSDR